MTAEFSDPTRAADLPSPEVTELLAGVLQDLRPQVDALVGGMAAEIARRVPGLGGDDLVLGAIERTARANMTTLLDLVAEPGLTSEAHPAAVALAGAFVRGDHPLSALIEAYRVGQALFFDAWFAALANRTSDADLLAAATAWSYRRACGFLDRVLARTSEQYLTERQQWQGRSLARRWRTMQAVIGDAVIDEAVASQALGYDLALTHVALIVSDGHDDPARDERDLDPTTPLAVAQEVARCLGAGRALALPAGPGLVFAWVGRDARPDLDALAAFVAPPGFRVAVGSPARGRDGFRRSHRQALWAQGLSRVARSLPAVVAYPRVAAAALLREDPEQLRAFVAEELGRLARRDSAAQELRTTVRVALACGLNASRAATELSMHKNTVLYRLRGAEELRGRPLTERRLELELALRIVETFGDDVLG